MIIVLGFLEFIFPDSFEAGGEHVVELAEGMVWEYAELAGYAGEVAFEGEPLFVEVAMLSLTYICRLLAEVALYENTFQYHATL